MAEWLRLCLAMREITGVNLVGELRFPCHGETALVPQLLRPQARTKAGGSQINK